MASLERHGAIGWAVVALSAYVSSVDADIAFVDGGIQAGIPVDCLTQMWVCSAAAADFNEDGFPDLYVSSGSNNPDRLFMNNGDGTFTDSAAAAGIGIAHYGWAATTGDYDNDGWVDIFVISAGLPPAPMDTGKNRLYHNNGNGTFTNKATSAGLLLVSSVFPGGKAAAFGDYDLDGDLDLALGYGAPLGSGGDKLMRNNGNGTFTNVTAAALGSPFAGVFTWCVRFADMNDDFYPELLWVADFGTSRYFVNDGDGTFTDMTIAAGAGTDEYGMGQCVNDVDNDGDADWYITSIIGFPIDNPVSVGNKLYLNDGKGAFVEVGPRVDVADGGWGWGTAAEDFDLDGDVDIVATSGRENGPPSWDDLLRVWRNNGDGTFTAIRMLPEYDDVDGRGLLTIDFDLDGDLDIVVTATNSQLYLLRNDSDRGNRAYLNVILDTDGMHSFRLAPAGQGSKITVVTDGQSRTRWMHGASNFYAQSQMIANFGLGEKQTVDSLTIAWVNGRTTTLHDVDVNQTLVVAYRPADLNGDGIVNGFDLALLLGAWTGAASYSPCAPALPADLNLDCRVNGLDLATLLGDWG